MPPTQDSPAAQSFPGSVTLHVCLQVFGVGGGGQTQLVLSVEGHVELRQIPSSAIQVNPAAQG